MSLGEEEGILSRLIATIISQSPRLCDLRYNTRCPVGTDHTIEKEKRQKNLSSIASIFRNNRQDEGEISLILMKRMNSKIF